MLQVTRFKFQELYCMVHITKKPRESIASLIRRFSRTIQLSGIVGEAKSRRFRSRPTTERKEQRRAIMREELRKLRISLEKKGQYSDEVFHKEKQRIKQELGF